MSNEEAFCNGPLQFSSHVREARVAKGEGRDVGLPVVNRRGPPGPVMCLVGPPGEHVGVRVDLTLVLVWLEGCTCLQ